MQKLTWSCILVFIGLAACDGETNLWKPTEHSPDSDWALNHFDELFAPAARTKFRQIREYEQGGPMDQFYLMTFVYPDESELITLLTKASFELVKFDEVKRKQQEETAAFNRKNSVDYDYDEVSQKLRTLGTPVWWNDGPRIKAPVWFRKNKDAPWGYTYVWRDSKTRTAYVQTQ